MLLTKICRSSSQSVTISSTVRNKFNQLLFNLTEHNYLHFRCTIEAQLQCSHSLFGRDVSLSHHLCSIHYVHLESLLAWRSESDASGPQNSEPKLGVSNSTSGKVFRFVIQEHFLTVQVEFIAGLLFFYDIICPNFARFNADFKSAHL